MAMLNNQRVKLTFINSHSYPDGHTSGIQISCDSQVPQMSGWSQRYEGWENPLVLGVRSSSAVRSPHGCPHTKIYWKSGDISSWRTKENFAYLPTGTRTAKSMYKAKSCGDIPCYMALNQINKIGFYLLYIIYIYISYSYIYIYGR